MTWQALADHDGGTRHVAVWLHPIKDVTALRAASPRDFTTVDAIVFEALRSRLAHARPKVRASALFALSNIADLRRSYQAGLCTATGALAGWISDQKSGIVSEATSVARGFLGDNDNGVRQTALKTILVLKPEGDRLLVETLVGLALNGRPAVRGLALEALGHVAVMGDEVAIAAVEQASAFTNAVGGTAAERGGAVRVAALCALCRLAGAGDAAASFLVRFKKTLIPRLKDDYWLVRAAAVTILARLAEIDDGEVVALVIGMLGDLDDLVRDAAWRAFSIMAKAMSAKPDAASVTVVDVADLLSHADGSVRLVATDALAKLADIGAGQEAWSAAAWYAGDSEANVVARIAGLRTMSVLADKPNAPDRGAALAEIASHLEDSNPRVRRDAARSFWACLGAARICGEVVDTLVKVIDSCGDDARVALLAALHEHEGSLERSRLVTDLCCHLPQMSDAGTVAFVLDILTSLAATSSEKATAIETADMGKIMAVAFAAGTKYQSSPAARQAAARALARVGNAKPEESLSFVATLAVGDVETVLRATAMQVLGSLAHCPAAAGYLKLMEASVRDRTADPSVRVAAAEALGRVAAGTGSRSSASAALRDALGECKAAAKGNARSDKLRAAAVEALGLIHGRCEQPVWETSAKELADDEVDPRWLCANLVALRHSATPGDRKALDRALPFLDAVDNDVRQAAVQAIQTLILPEDSASYCEIIRRFQHRHGGVRKSAVELMQTLNETVPTEAVEKAQRLLRDPYTGARDSAAESLGFLPHRDVGVVVDLLVARLADDDYFVRNAAAVALGRLADRSDDARCRIRAVVIELLQHEELYVQLCALKCLGHACKQGDEEVVSAVVEFWQEVIALDEMEHRDVRRSVLEVLGALASEENASIAAVVETCATALRDPSYGVARVAFTSLLKISQASVTGKARALAASSVPALCAPHPAT